MKTVDVMNFDEFSKVKNEIAGDMNHEEFIKSLDLKKYILYNVKTKSFVPYNFYNYNGNVILFHVGEIDNMEFILNRKYKKVDYVELAKQNKTQPDGNFLIVDGEMYQ